jgi:hypothetical protein
VLIDDDFDTTTVLDPTLYPDSEGKQNNGVAKELNTCLLIRAIGGPIFWIICSNDCEMHSGIITRGIVHRTYVALDDLYRI